ncbi:DNA polymerase IV [Pokkaliibacter plantistimulans]|uniref:DNA polymerase IV n=1 Tax=Proteobacteria bacterium 228 TaxID=2083153 RepID=A0A2S5KQM3_9PROT|nr:DNA polymerase IV [Pokkaliibacter plantistimulans]PPC76839.1 DNA polymerase IV [Pokkaliibacter plantistimulans]
MSVDNDSAVPAQHQRKIIHFDCDCFYAAVEMRDHPPYRDIPLAIGGRPDKRGVIATCNYPARKFGVRSAMPSSHALRLCPNLTLIPGNMAKYRDVSRAFMAILAEFSDHVEPLSLDEAFIDVSSSDAFQGSATRIASHIRERVRNELGITVSAGVAPNKFLAKIASDWHKPDGMKVIPPHEVESFVLPLPVEKIWGVGKVTAARMHELGLYTCADVQGWSQQQLQERFGRFGQQLFRLSRGEDQRPVEAREERLSLSVEHTYDQDLPDLASCLAQLPRLEEELQQRLARRQLLEQIQGRVVKMKFHDFQQTTVERHLQRPDSDYASLLTAAWQRGQRPVRLIGVGVRLKAAAATQQPQQLSLVW